jgi:hypothetical protein
MLYTNTLDRFSVKSSPQMAIVLWVEAVTGHRCRNLISGIKELCRFLTKFAFFQMKYNVVQFVNPELHNLYKWLEVEFHPLKLAQRISSSLEYIEKNEELVQFIPALQDITIMRILKQVCVLLTLI